MREAGPGEAQSWEEINLELVNKHVKCRAQRPPSTSTGVREPLAEAGSSRSPVGPCLWPAAGRHGPCLDGPTLPG